MLHCFKKDTAKEIYDVYGERSITVQTVRNWFRRFRAGNFKAYLDENPRSNVREIADTLNIPRTTIHDHLTKLEYVNRYEVWAPIN